MLVKYGSLFYWVPANKDPYYSNNIVSNYSIFKGYYGSIRDDKNLNICYKIHGSRIVTIMYKNISRCCQKAIKQILIEPPVNIQYQILTWKNNNDQQSAMVRQYNGSPFVVFWDCDGDSLQCEQLRNLYNNDEKFKKQIIICKTKWEQQRQKQIQKKNR